MNVLYICRVSEYQARGNQIDIPKNTINVLVPDEVLAERRSKWQPREPRITTGYLARYAKSVTSGCTGAVLK